MICKKAILSFLLITLLLIIVFCISHSGTKSPLPVESFQKIAEEKPPIQDKPPDNWHDFEKPSLENLPGKIVVLTNIADQHKEAYYSAERMVKKYGDDKIIHITWPEQESCLGPINTISWVST